MGLCSITYTLRDHDNGNSCLIEGVPSWLCDDSTAWEDQLDRWQSFVLAASITAITGSTYLHSTPLTDPFIGQMRKRCYGKGCLAKVNGYKFIKLCYRRNVVAFCHKSNPLPTTTPRVVDTEYIE